MCSNLEVEDQQSKMQMNEWGGFIYSQIAPLYVVNITYLVGYYSGLASLVVKN